MARANDLIYLHPTGVNFLPIYWQTFGCQIETEGSLRFLITKLRDSKVGLRRITVKSYEVGWPHLLAESDISTYANTRIKIIKQQQRKQRASFEDGHNSMCCIINTVWQNLAPFYVRWPGSNCVSTTFSKFEKVCLTMDYLRMDGKQYGHKVRNKALDDFDWLIQWVEWKFGAETG